MTEYYYEQLPKEQKRAYTLICRGLLALQDEIPVPRLSNRELTELYLKVRLDHPEIFYTAVFSYHYYEDSASVILTPEYVLKKKQIEDHSAAIRSRIEKLLRQAPKEGTYEREKWIHDFICTNVRYDKLKKYYSHEVLGPLTQGIGVCEGIAKTVKLLCDRLDIPCIVVLSESNPDKGIKYRHAWNLISVDKKWYHFDATFDNSLGSGAVRYDYFNLGDVSAFRDHEPSIWSIPGCEEHAKCYYVRERLSFTKMEDLRKRMSQYAKKGKLFIFHWRGGFLTREVLGQILTMAEETAAGFGKCASMKLNWPQAVMQVSFEQGTQAGEAVFQEANEGEQE